MRDNYLVFSIACLLHWQCIKIFNSLTPALAVLCFSSYKKILCIKCFIQAEIKREKRWVFYIFHKFLSVITFPFIRHRDDHCWPLLYISYNSCICWQSFYVNKIYLLLAEPGSTVFDCKLSGDWIIHYISIKY